MAGLPGAGKTELSRALIEISGLSPIRIDMDELATTVTGYTPETADTFRLASSTLLTELYSKVIRNKLDFIMDGTFSSKTAELNINAPSKKPTPTSKKLLSNPKSSNNPLFHHFIAKITISWYNREIVAPQPVLLQEGRTYGTQKQQAGIRPRK